LVRSSFLISQGSLLASAPSTATPVNIKGGVAPLRAGQGHSFFWRRLHSLTGIVPVGLFLIEHFISNAFATKGPGAYTKQVEFLSSFPFVVGLELFGIWLPILYHSLYGFYIWYRGESNVGEYPWAGNWMYTSQRWTGAIVFFYMVWHTWHLRFSGVHLLTYPASAFGKVQNELFGHPLAVAFYIVGIVCASWHFAYGLWLFAAKWGIAQGPIARRRWGYACFVIAVAFIAVGMVTMYSFLTTPPQPYQPAGNEMDSFTMR
jgi:succinate dehydrogenase / fumarate reductase cytochrome b subunit